MSDPKRPESPHDPTRPFHRTMTAHEAHKADRARRLSRIFRKPVPDPYVVTYAYGEINPEYARGYHTGEDYACPVGTPVTAVRRGVVIEASSDGLWGDPYGLHVVVESKTWRGTRRWAVCHLSQISVAVGQHVTANMQLGLSGQTGNVHGPHVHLEARKIDSSWVGWQGAPYGYGCDVSPRQVRVIRVGSTRR